MMPEESFPPHTKPDNIHTQSLNDRTIKLLNYLLAHEWNMSSGGINAIKNHLKELEQIS